MIITVTLNPALDKTVYIKHVELGRVNKVEKSIVDPGGKGINVSKVLKNLDSKAVCMGFLGGKNGQFMKESLKELDIAELFTPVEANTRMNIKIIDENTGETTDLNERGETIHKNELDSFLTHFKEIIQKDDLVVFSGSAPSGIPHNIYLVLSKYVEDIGAKVFLDTSGDLLKEALNTKLFLIKPNAEELAEAIGVDLDSEEKIIEECRKLLDAKVNYICLSRGSEGAMLIGNEFILKATVPKVTVKSTVGAGDSLLGGIVAYLDKGYTMEAAFKYGIAASVVAVTKEGTKAPSLSEMNDMLEKITVIREESV